MSPTSASPDRRQTIRSVAKAALLLEELSRQREGATTLRLAELSGLDRTTVHRVLRTLGEHDLVRSRGSRWVLGPTALILGSAFVDQLTIRRAALPYAIDLQRATAGRRVVISVDVWAGPWMLVVERIWNSRAPLRVILDIGPRLDLATSASGRAVLSQLPDETVTGLLDAAPSAQLAAALAETRARDGLALSHSEIRVGLSACAAPLLGTGGVPLGSLVVAGLDLDADLHPSSELAQHLLHCALRISTDLSASP